MSNGYTAICADDFLAGILSFILSSFSNPDWPFY